MGSTSGTTTNHRKPPLIAGPCIIAILDNGTEEYQNATKTYKILWDLEEEDHRNSMQLEPPQMVAGVTQKLRSYPYRRHDCKSEQRGVEILWKVEDDPWVL